MWKNLCEIKENKEYKSKETIKMKKKMEERLVPWKEFLKML